MDNRFNLIDEPWIPVADQGLVSLKAIFINNSYKRLGGSPIQKIAIFKLLLAIAQSSATPFDKKAWQDLQEKGLAIQCLDYLSQWHERFYLYGAMPFLQMPEIKKAKLQSIGALMPEVSTGNTTVLMQSQQPRLLTDADKALLLVTQMAFALGGKKTDNSAVLSHDYAGKRNDKGRPSTARPGPAVEYMGLLHSFLLGDNVLETLWLNLLTTDQIHQMGMFTAGLGVAPWEHMPETENCDVAKSLQQSLIGRLVPLCRFCLLHSEGVHYSEGIVHLGYKEGITDPSAATDYSAKKPRALWVNPDKRPWRELTALLGFIDATDSKGFECWQLTHCIDRARDVVSHFSIWSAGLKVSSNAGEQYVSGGDDFVESAYLLAVDQLGAIWFAHFNQEMTQLDKLAKHIYGCVMGFFKEQQVDGSKVAAQATQLFWQLCERQAQELLDYCDDSIRCARLWQYFTQYAYQVYDIYCSNQTVRQLDAWAKNRPKIYKYLKQET